jgi:hypothetical protein
VALIRLAAAQRRMDRGPAANAAGVTALLVRRLQRRRPPTDTRSGGSAADVPPSEPQANDWRGGRAGPSLLELALGRPGLGCGGWPGMTIWLVRSAQERNAVKRGARAAGQVVKRAVVRATREGHQGPRSPATGRAALVMTAGAAGLAELREGLKPEGSRRAAARCAARQPGPAQRERAMTRYRRHRLPLAQPCAATTLLGTLAARWQRLSL